MADTDREALVAQFAGISGVDTDRARFFLESSAWHLDVALEAFYDSGDTGGPPAAATPPAAAPPESPPKQQSKKTGSASGSRFATLESLRDSDDDEASEEGQAFYVGGSDRGAGQQVLGPPKKKKSPNDLIQDMFKSAKEHGAEVVEPGTSSSARASVNFHGTGYRLGDLEGAPSAMVMGKPVQQRPQQVDMVLKLWKNGFSISDGPLRSYQDEENKEFLDSIHKGEVPRELIRMAKGGEVNLNMEDHREEEYVKPKVQMQAFTGAGHVLGSVAPNVTSAPEPKAGGNTSAGATVNIDPSKPTTQLQLRLADGSRMVAKFNHTNTVADVRQHIINSHPEFAATTFVLMTTFPNKELTDESVTLEDAKLLNAVIVQRKK